MKISIAGAGRRKTSYVVIDILINTIFCGDYNQGISGKWQDGAQLGGGDYMTINQLQHIDPENRFYQKSYGKENCEKIAQNLEKLVEDTIGIFECHQIVWRACAVPKCIVSVSTISLRINLIFCSFTNHLMSFACDSIFNVIVMLLKINMNNVSARIICKKRVYLIILMNVLKKVSAFLPIGFFSKMYNFNSFYVLSFFAAH